MDDFLQFQRRLEDMPIGGKLRCRYATITRGETYWTVEPCLAGYRYVGDSPPATASASTSRDAAALVRSLSWQVYNSLIGKEPEPMRELYEVFIIDIHAESDSIVYHGYHVAESEKEATVEAAVAAKLGKAKGHHFIVRDLGNVPAAKAK